MGRGVGERRRRRGGVGERRRGGRGVGGGVGRRVGREEVSISSVHVYGNLRGEERERGGY